MKRYTWALALLLMTLILAAPFPAAAQCGGGQMDHSMMMGSGHMGGSGTMGSGNMGSGNMGYGQMGGCGQMGPDNMTTYGYTTPAPVPSQPAGTWTPVPSGEMTGNPNHSGHDHNH